MINSLADSSSTYNCKRYLREDASAYAEWRAKKLDAAERLRLGVKPIQLSSVEPLSGEVRDDFKRVIEDYGFAYYSLDANAIEAFTATNFKHLCAQLGLLQLDSNRCAHEDGITRLQVDTRGERINYIPYSNRAINWHTDGYYNDTEHRIKAFALHCVRSAGQGGESILFDHELLYILMRDENPRLVQALFREDALAIPQNAVNTNNIREEQLGPVFWIDTDSGELQMRFTARTRSIRWNSDTLIQEAVAMINHYLQHSPYKLTHRLQPGEGIVSNNCLHGRVAFSDSDDMEGRLLWRARFFDRVSITDPLC